MAVWLNMTNQDASPCASLDDGIEKIKSMFALRLVDGAKITPDPARISMAVRYQVTSLEYGDEEFWLSQEPQSRRP